MRIHNSTSLIIATIMAQTGGVRGISDSRWLFIVFSLALFCCAAECREDPVAVAADGRRHGHQQEKEELTIDLDHILSRRGLDFRGLPEPHNPWLSSIDLDPTSPEDPDRSRPERSLVNGQHFSWQDCGKNSSGKVAVTHFDLSPDPLLLGSIAYIRIDIQFPGPLTNISAKVEISKFVSGQWRKAPCFYDFGSCDYDDVCAMLNKIHPGGACPTLFKKAHKPCTCPFPGDYLVAVLAVKVPSVRVIPPSIVLGKYQVRIQLSGEVPKLGRHHACLQFETTVA